MTISILTHAPRQTIRLNFMSLLNCWSLLL